MTQLDVRSKASDPTATQAPIVVDLGKVKRKRIKQLKRGEGVLLDDVQEAVVRVRERLGEQATGKVLVPVVVVYRKKASRRRRRLAPWLPS
jgi:hypothetical protein